MTEIEALQSGDAMRAAGDLDGAERTLRALVEAGSLPGWSHFMLGRVLRDADRPHEAVACFEAALAGGGPAFWSRYERLVLMRWWEEAAYDTGRSIADLLDAPPEPLGADHVRELEAVANVAWDRGAIRPARALLERLADTGALSPLGLRRLDRPVDPVAEAVLLTARTEVPVLPAHRLVLERRRLVAPADPETWLALAMLAAREGHVGEAAGLLEQGDAFAPVVRSLGHLAVAAEAGDERAHDRLIDHARLFGVVPRRLGLLAAAPLEAGPRAELLSMVESAHPSDPDVARALAWAWMEQGGWERAESVLAAVFPEGAATSVAAHAAYADLMAVRGQVVEAAALIEAGRAGGTIPTELLPSHLRVLGELGRWDAVLDAVMAATPAEDRFEGVLAPAVRASRRTGRTAVLFDRMVAAPPSEARDRALAALAETTGSADAVSRAAKAGVSDGLLVRARRAAAAPAGDDLCIFLCADAAYLEPALVSLTSMVTTNASLLARAQVQLIVDASVLQRGRAAGSAIARAFRLGLTVMEAQSLAAGRLDYGIFTGGAMLADAAYWRIGHARALAAAGRYRTALYLDADTLVRAGLRDLAELPTDAPLLARFEPDRGAVRRAAALHRLKGRYFNSGVLRFALDHPDTLPALDRALTAMTDPAVPLLFHDQCALNIGFDGLAQDLPARFNHYRRPGGPDEGAGADAVVVHYLDRPKPWDALYPEPASEWFGWAELVRHLAPESAALPG